MSVVIGRDVQQAYESIVAGGDITWAVFAYDGQSDLKVQATGANDLCEFPDEFSDGRLQYAFLKVLEPNSKLPKLVLVGWCGDGAPRKGIFQQHFSSVAAKLNGYHVQITARSEEDVSEENIMKKVEDASGAKYSMATTASVFGQKITPRKATTNSLVSQLKGQNAPTFNARKPTQTEPRLPPTASKPSTVRTTSSATKIGSSWDAPKPSTRATSQSEQPAGTTRQAVQEPVKSSYQPIGRPDIDALRAQAGSESPSLSNEKTGTAYQPVEVPKTGSLANRMSAFTSSTNESKDEAHAPRKVSNPLASRYGSAITGTKPAEPTSGPRESKAIGGLAKNFGSEGGKTPSQLWAERKARERGESIPEPVKEAPVKATTYDNDGSGDRHEANVHSLRNQFAESSLQDDTFRVQDSMPSQSRPSMAVPVIDSAVETEAEAEAEPEELSETPQVAVPPPPPSMTTRPGATGHVHASPPSSVPSSSVHGIQGDEEESRVLAREPSASPEPAAPKNDFKARLEQSLGPNPAVTPSAATIGLDGMSESGSVGLQARVIYEYEAQEENELSLSEGGLVTEIEQVDEGWWSGKDRDTGKSGLFPSNYVELLDTNEDEEMTSVAPLTPESGSKGAGNRGQGLCAIAVYEYEAAEEGEVGFAEGDLIESIDQIDEGWWSGTNPQGETGLFPSNYVEVVQ